MFKVKMAAIYKISCNDYYYIGYSTDTYGRWQNHYTDLKNKKHSSTEFQKLWDITTPEDWTWQILEYVSITNFKKESNLKGKQLELKFRQHLLKLEKKYMSEYSINFCLNKDNKHFSK